MSVMSVDPGRSERMTKAMRLRRRPEFLAASHDGTKFMTRNFIALLAPRPGADQGRLGLTVTKKVGHSPTRNRIRRMVRDWMRTHGWIQPGWDVVLIAKHGAAAIRRRADVEVDLASVLRHVARLSGVQSSAAGAEQLSR